jgi:hypothetical protein
LESKTVASAIRAERDGFQKFRVEGPRLATQVAGTGRNDLKRRQATVANRDPPHIGEQIIAETATAEKNTLASPPEKFPSQAKNEWRAEAANIGGNEPTGAGAHRLLYLS